MTCRVQEDAPRIWGRLDDCLASANGDGSGFAFIEISNLEIKVGLLRIPVRPFWWLIIGNLLKADVSRILDLKSDPFRIVVVFLDRSSHDLAVELSKLQRVWAVERHKAKRRNGHTRRLHLESPVVVGAYCVWRTAYSGEGSESVLRAWFGESNDHLSPPSVTLSRTMVRSALPRSVS